MWMILVTVVYFVFRKYRKEAEQERFDQLVRRTLIRIEVEEWINFLQYGMSIIQVELVKAYHTGITSDTIGDTNGDSTESYTIDHSLRIMTNASFRMERYSFTYTRPDGVENYEVAKRIMSL